MILKQSTAFTFRIGPFVDDADGKTAETGLTIARADIQISKNGGAFAQTSASPTTTHDTDGWYQCPLTATDTGTLGTLDVQIAMAGALPVWRHFVVVPAVVYDSLVAGSDYLTVDAVQIEGVDATNQIRDAVVDDATRIDASALNTLSGHDPGEVIMGATDLGTGAGLTSLATAANLTTLTGYVDTEVAAILAAVDTEVAAIKAKTDYLPSATAGAAGGVFIAGANAATSVTTALTANITGNVSGSVGSVTGNVGGSVASVAANGITATSIAADAINAAAVKADAVTKIQNGLATPTNITAGTITTVTNLTNAPTNGDLTATMKTSVTTAATAATPTAAAVTGAVGSVTGAVGSVTGNVGGNVVGSVGSVTGAVGSVTGSVGGNVAGSVGSVTNAVTVGTNNDKTGYSLSSAGVQAVWDALTSALTTAGSVGKRIADYLDAAVSSRSTYAGGDTSGTTTLLSRIVGTLASGTHNAQSGDAYARLGAPAGASVSADVAAVKAQTAAIEADTQDLQTQIGTDGAGLTAIGDTRLANLNATVSSRLATAGYTAPLDAAGTRTAVGLATANLDTQLSGLPTDADVQAAAAAALTAYDPPTNAEMEARTLAAASYATAAALDAVDNYIDTEIAAIKAKTDNLPASPAAVGSAMTLTAAYDAAKTAASQASVDDLPTVAEFEARTLPAADYTVVSDLPSVPSAASIADAVWDEAIAGHAGAGSTGAALAAAGAAGDPWATALPGAYGAGTAGKLLSDIEAVAPDNKPTVAATGEASANVTKQAGVAVAAADANGNVLVNVRAWDDDLLSEGKLSVRAQMYEDGNYIDLSYQAIRDAMLLAASAGAPPPAAGSVDAKLNAATNPADPWAATLPGGYAGQEAGAILGRLAELDTTAVTQVSSSLAGHLTITRGLTFAEAVTGLTIPVDWEAAYWTLKRNPVQPDTAALVRLLVTNPAGESDGLQRLNGAEPASPITVADGTLTVTQATGRIDIWLSDELTACLSAGTSLGWDVKFIDSAGDSTGRRGTADVVLTETHATA